MNSLIAKITILLAICFVANSLKADEVIISDLDAQYRNGQVFLTWREPAGEHEITFNAYISRKPIETSDDLPRAVLLASRIEAHSARDWWKAPATYFLRESVNYEPEGFVTAEGGEPLDPSGGLFVHTVGINEPEYAYYAVTATITGIETVDIVRGGNALAEPVFQQQAEIQPIWLGAAEDKPGMGSADGLPAIMSLHGRTGSQPLSWLVFGTREMGWREGLPFKFHAVLTERYLWIAPMDRTWLGRTLSDSKDQRDHISPANDTFWYGYNDHVFDKLLMAEGTPVNFTERRNLWILSWAKKYFEHDVNRLVLEGASMGGSGGLSWGLRHPELFSAVIARVPCVGYFDEDWGGSERRLIAYCGPLDRLCNEGISLRKRMDARTILDEADKQGIDLPYLVISNGRSDASIPWKPNPRFYRALNRSRQGFVVGWDNGLHQNCMANASEWFLQKSDPEKLFRLSLDSSFPAFSNYSGNDEPGNGNRDDGDISGYMNFGLEWKDIIDERNKYEITIYSVDNNVSLPAMVDVTIRRPRNFVVEPRDSIFLINRSLAGEEIISKKAQADKNGRVSFERFELTSTGGNRLVVLKNNL